jgi:hypothetical protein
MRGRRGGKRNEKSAYLLGAVTALLEIPVAGTESLKPNNVRRYPPHTTEGRK